MASLLEASLLSEADGDRLVYQTTWETLADEFNQDIHFATVGGTGGIADTCNLYRTLRIPVAVVADLDVIADPEKLKKIIRVSWRIPHKSELQSRGRERSRKPLRGSRLRFLPKN